MPGDALMRYTVPMPDDSMAPGKATEKVALPDAVLSTVHDGGDSRTGNILLKKWLTPLSSGSGHGCRKLAADDARVRGVGAALPVPWRLVRQCFS